MGTEAKLYEVVNTVNTTLNNSYDFGIHKAGCRDVSRAVSAGCTVEQIEAGGTLGVFDAIRGDLIDGGFEPDEAACFSIKAFGCCSGAS